MHHTLFNLHHEAKYQAVMALESNVPNELFLKYPSPPLRQGEIRLLHLHPGFYSLPLHCSLESVFVGQGERPKFEALSYTWGAALERRSVLVKDAGEFPVTDNLWYALRRLRRLLKIRTLWVDAICINQQDLTERADQVRIMYDIYSYAERGIVWLGESSRPRLPAYTTITEGYPERRSLCWRIRERLIPYLLCSESSRSIWLSREFDAALASTEPHWFDRVWTIQEAAASKRLAVCFGPRNMPWADFVALFINRAEDYFLRSHTSNLHVGQWLSEDTRYRLFQKCMEYMLIRDNRDKGPIRLSYLANSTKHSRATDPRDKVFGLLGLLPPATSANTRPDYGQRACEIFASATFAAICSEKTLLIWQCMYPGECSIAGVPSWAIDFAAAGSRRDFDFLDLMQTVLSLNFSENVSMHASPQSVSLSQDVMCLTVYGRLLDRVDALECARQDQRYSNLRYMPLPIQSGLWHAFRSNPIRTLSAGRFDASKVVPSNPYVETEPAIDRGELESFVCQSFEAWNQIVHPPFEIASINLSMQLLSDYMMFVAKAFAIISTAGGFLGYALDTVRKDDMVVLLHGSGLPVILRAQEDRWTFQGFAFIHSVVDVTKDTNSVHYRTFDYWWKRQDLTDRDFVLV